MTHLDERLVKTGHGWKSIVKRAELFAKANQYLPNGRLTILCEVSGIISVWIELIYKIILYHYRHMIAIQHQY